MNEMFTLYMHKKDFFDSQCVDLSQIWTFENKQEFYLEMSGMSSSSNEVAARTASASLARARA
jgi:hypothetical protein